MLIGIDASRANLEKKTGVEWYSYNLIKEIIKQAPIGQFFLYFREEPKNFDNLPKNFKIKILSSPFKRFWTQFRLSLEMLVHPIDLLFVPAAAIPIIHPKKTITVIHDIGFKRFQKTYPFLERLYLNFSTKFALKHCFKIIIPSEFTKKELIEIYGDESWFDKLTVREKIFVVPHGYDPKIFRLIDNREKISQILKKYKIKKPFFLYIGRIEAKKNIKGLIKAFSIFKNFTLNTDRYTLVLVGEGKLKIENCLPAEALAQAGKLKIRRLGYVEKEDLPYLLNATEAFIFPSLYEGFGLPILEAFACASPVIASNIEAIKEIVQEAAILVNPQNPKEIAEAMKKIIEDQFLRKYLIEKGLERVKNFSWEKCVKETLEIIFNF